jgi:hypothetical protein
MSAEVSLRGSPFADRHTPLVRNCWYFAALAKDITQEVSSRFIVETKVLLYRTAEGRVVALHDRCPHRSFPLSQGFKEGDEVVCGSHFSYLHSDTVGTPEYAQSPFTITVHGRSVQIVRQLMNCDPPPIYGIPMKLMGHKVDRFSDSWFLSPAAHVAHAKIVDPAGTHGGRTDFRVEIMHLITPMTLTKFHYQWFVARDFALGDIEVSEYLEKMTVKAYLEDVAALRWIEEVNELEPREYRELSFRADKAGLDMRRIIKSMANEEQGSPAGTKTASEENVAAASV